jgi:hypothetical protein
MATQENNDVKRAHYDTYIDKKMPRDRHKKPRLCSGNMTLLTEHIRSMENKHRGKCKYCGKFTYMMCTLCGVHVCWKEGLSATNLTCILYHDNEFYITGSVWRIVIPCLVFQPEHIKNQARGKSERIKNT